MTDAQLDDGAALKIISFYTPDQYYAKAATEFRESMQALGAPHFIYEFAPGKKDWVSITAYKVNFIVECFAKFKDQRLVWVDIDTKVSRIPEQFERFNSDILGFNRGFQGYSKLNFSQRLMSPVILGFRRSAVTTKFLQVALDSAIAETPATDDFLFEEAFRKAGDELSIQFLPRNLVRQQGKKLLAETCFSVGSSGSVPLFRDKVPQHTSRRPMNNNTSVLFHAAEAARLAIMKIKRKVNRIRNA